MFMGSVLVVCGEGSYGREGEGGAQETKRSAAAAKGGTRAAEGSGDS